VVIYVPLLQQSMYTFKSYRVATPYLNTCVQLRLFIVVFLKKNHSCTFTQIHYPLRYVYLYRVTLKTCFTRHRLGWSGCRTSGLAPSGCHHHIFGFTRTTYTCAFRVFRVLELDALDSARLINFALW